MFRENIESLLKYEIKGVPIGFGVGLSVADGLADAIFDLVKKFIPGGTMGITLGAVGAAFALGYTRILERVGGPQTELLVNGLLVKKAVDNVIPLGDMIKSGIAKITGAVGELPSYETSSEVGETPAISEQSVGQILRTADYARLRRRQMEMYSK
ncbi:MAG TPA: hypothetical protein ENG63_06945 [Candidatus Desulfofervidus auxilii]|uniref:Uncharacterized protein n=1 Tax=Desulfofervidus auxilii TaxID=1621989 RepID=A0A7C0Y4V6_DESA2|nr:hypothetical protein [Candidatus Desulfofervidus auxilii]